MTLSDARGKRVTPPLEYYLEARGLSFSYGPTSVLYSVDFAVQPGSSVAIMGKSGSGKSTLLHLLAGLMLPTSGEIVVDGLPFSSLPERARNRARLEQFGFIFQFGELLPELSIIENVELPLLFLGWKRSDARDAAGDILARVGLGNVVARGISAVSGGQQQRAAVARALVHRPSVVLADEPTGSLDEETAEFVLDLVLGDEIVKNAAVVIVTHSESVAASCDNVLELRNGVLESRA